MGFFRKSGLVLLSVILAILLIALGTILTLGFSITYENVQKTVPPILKQIFLTEETQQQMSWDILQLQISCNRTNSESVALPLNNSDFPELVVPCSEVYKGTDAVVDYGVNQLVSEMYYQDYTCTDFSNCLNKSPTYLVSDKFRGKLTHYSLILLIISLVCFVFVFLLARKKSNACFIIGGIIAGVSLLLLAINRIFGSILSSLPSSREINPSSFVDVFFSSSTSIFLIFLVFGLAFIIVGVVLKVLASNRSVEDDETD